MRSPQAALQTSKEGAERISELLCVLNKWPDEPALKQLATILELAKRAEELQLERRPDRRGMVRLTMLLNRPAAGRFSPTTDHDVNRVLKHLNALLGSYRFSLSLRDNAQGCLDRLLIPAAKNASERWVTEAVSWITDLVRNRTLSRLRRCRHCAKWIYAERSHQFYCNDSCRKKFASTADDFKRKRREYMARYRGTLKQREMSRLANVRGKKR